MCERHLLLHICFEHIQIDTIRYICISMSYQAQCTLCTYQIINELIWYHLYYACIILSNILYAFIHHNTNATFYEQQQHHISFLLSFQCKLYLLFIVANNNTRFHWLYYYCTADRNIYIYNSVGLTAEPQCRINSSFAPGPIYISTYIFGSYGGG